MNWNQYGIYKNQLKMLRWWLLSWTKDTLNCIQHDPALSEPSECCLKLFNKDPEKSLRSSGLYCWTRIFTKILPKWGFADRISLGVQLTKNVCQKGFPREGISLIQKYMWSFLLQLWLLLSFTERNIDGLEVIAKKT
jgi:hypothetical protein